MKIAILSSRFPYPLDKGDKLRLYHQMKSLSEVADIYLISLTDQEIQDTDFQKVKQYCKEVHVFHLNKTSSILTTLRKSLANKPLQVSYYYNASIHKKIETLLSTIKPDHIYCQLARMAEYVRKYPSPKTLDYMDAFSVGMKRRSEVVSFFKKRMYLRETNRMSRYEKNIYADFDHHVIISKQDADLLSLGHLDVVSNGIDAVFFKFKEREDARFDIGFVGNMGYLPNVAAAEYLVHHIVNPLLEANTSIKTLIAGARPSRRVQQLESTDVSISGWMDDIRSAYYDSRIFVAPLFNGTGQQNKILEAMSTGSVVITTPEVNEAIGATPDKELLVANNKSAFIENIKKLQNSPDKRKDIARAARKFIEEQYSWEAQNKKLITLFKKVK